MVTRERWPEVDVSHDFDVPYPGQVDTFHPTERTIAFISTHHDDCCHENPLEDCDEMGSIHSFHRNHRNLLRLLAVTRDEAVEELDEMFGEDWVLLGYYEHGQCDWHVSHERKPGVEYQWDGTSFGGVWVPDEGLLSYVKDLEGAERHNKLKEYARQACTVYTQWCNGEVYGYNFDVYSLRFEGDYIFDRKDDYRMADELHHDSCWGFYGWIYFEEEAKSAVEWFLDNKLEDLK